MVEGEGDAAPAAQVDEVEGRPRPAGLVDANDVGAVVGHRVGCERPGQAARDVDDTDAAEVAHAVLSGTKRRSETSLEGYANDARAEKPSACTKTLPPPAVYN